MLVGLLLWLGAIACAPWFYGLARSRNRSSVLWALAAFVLFLATGITAVVTVTEVLLPQLGEGETWRHWLFLFVLPLAVPVGAVVVLRAILRCLPANP